MTLTNLIKKITQNKFRTAIAAVGLIYTTLCAYETSRVNDWIAHSNSVFEAVIEEINTSCYYKNTKSAEKCKEARAKEHLIEEVRDVKNAILRDEPCIGGDWYYGQSLRNSAYIYSIEPVICPIPINFFRRSK